MESHAKPPLKIAIVRLSAMGDIIHSASVLPQLLLELQKNYVITLYWYVDERFQEILSDSPCITKCIALPLKRAMRSKSLTALLYIFRILRKESFDVVLDMQGLLKSAIISRILRTKMRVGFAQAKESLASLFYDKKIPIPYEKHILLRNATLAFGAFSLEIPPLESLKSAQNFLGFQAQNFPILTSQSTKILFVLETSKPNKTYPISLFIELATLFNAEHQIPFFLTQTKITIPNPQNADFHSIYDLNLSEVKSLVAQMDLIIGGDTGITHLAWALHRPSITLFGATPPERFNLTTPQNQFLSAKSIQGISPTQIFKCAQALLHRNPKC